MARLEAGGQVFGEGGVVERAPGEPVPEAAERTLVGAPGVRADRSGGELAGRLPDGRGLTPRGVPFECGSHLRPSPHQAFGLGGRYRHDRSRPCPACRVG